jgi:cytoskeletal protein RodZ
MEVRVASGTVGQARATRLNLAAIRRNRGLSLHDIADHTAISTRYLQGIEDERFEVLPGLIYSVSYIKQYAKAIDYDADLILGLFRETAHRSRPENADFRANTSARPADHQGSRRLRWERYRRVINGVITAVAGRA